MYHLAVAKTWVQAHGKRDADCGANPDMRMMITGVTGFIGSALARHLVSQGHIVLGSSRRAPVQLKHLPPEVKIEPLTLGGHISRRFFDNVDYVIHCAHDFSQDGLDRNIRGTKDLFERAKASGTRQQAFVSSYSASKNAVTSYGIAKYQLERFFSDRNSLILKPGLVLGPGGMITVYKAWGIRRQERNVIMRALVSISWI